MISCALSSAEWSIRERRISGLDIKFQSGAPSAEPGSGLRMKVDILGESMVKIWAPSAKAGSGGLQGVVDRLLFHTS